MLSNLDIIGAGSIVATILIGFLGSFGLYWKRRRDRRRRLRKAFLYEITGISTQSYAEAIVDGELLRRDGYQIPETSPFSDAVYRANTSKIGLLSDEEVRDVVEFYSEAIKVEKEIKRAHGDRDSVLSNQPFITIYRLLELNNKRNDLEKLLRKKLKQCTDDSSFYYVDMDEWDPERVIQEVNCSHLQNYIPSFPYDSSMINNRN